MKSKKPKELTIPKLRKMLAEVSDKLPLSEVVVYIGNRGWSLEKDQVILEKLCDESGMLEGYHLRIQFVENKKVKSFLKYMTTVSQKD